VHRHGFFHSFFQAAGRAGIDPIQLAPPAGAQIEVNGEFIGNTPSTVTAKEGSVTVTVKKPGYQPWQRTLTLNPGDKRTLAELVKNPNVYRID
jgi:hypothetical protein